MIYYLVIFIYTHQPDFMEDITTLQKDLDESRQREKDLALRNEELEDFMENAAMPLHWVNGSGIILWANKAELELLGYEKEEYVGKHISNFHADKNVINDILQRLINKQTLKNHPSILKAKNGSLIPVIINSNVRWESDKFIHTRCFTRDISDLRQVEKEKIELINELQEKNIALKAEVEGLKNQLKASTKPI